MKTSRSLWKLRMVAAIAWAVALSVAAESRAAEASPELARRPARRVERTTSRDWMSDVASRLAILEVHAGRRAERASLARRSHPSTIVRAGERP